MAQLREQPSISPAVSFLMMLFSHTTEQPIYLSSLPNERFDPDEAPERHVCTREGVSIDAMMHKWDRPKRGMFFCVGTVNGTKRNKDAIAETPFLWTDIDFKGVVEDEPTIRARLASLRYPPSLIVRSGNGLHCYWLLTEAWDTQEHRDRIEAVLRQLADLVAGDLQVCEVSRLMRLPGSHNSKGTTDKNVVWKEVVMEPVNGEPHRYELDDLEEWLSECAPVLHRKAQSTIDQRRATTVIETNPFLEHAKRAGFTPPLDVEKALDEMTFGNIHATQLSVTAALLNAGREIDWVIDTVLDATARAAGDLGTRWNWTREKRSLRAMCETWLAKHPREISPHNPDGQSGEKSAPPPIDKPAPRKGEVVIDLATRTAREPKPKPKASKLSLHTVLAETLLAVLEERGGALLFTDEGAYRYSDHLWHLQTDAVMKAWLDTMLQTAAHKLSMEASNKLISEARNWIMRHDELRTTAVPWDCHGQVPTRSGLVHPRTLELTPPSPAHYATWRIETDYDANATCPLWLQMLDDVFADRDLPTRAAHVALLQEMLGAGLIDSGKPKELSLALVIEGGSDTGKSGLVHVMAGLFGVSHSTPLEALNSPHGLMPFAYRRPWAVHEAFDQGKWLLSAIAKALISGEPIQINVKGGPQIERVFTAPIFWATNHPPQFKEATKAITNRIVVVRCRREFNRDRKTGVAAIAAAQGFGKPSDLVLAREMPGLLAWALAGLQRALVRGNFVLPDEAQRAAEEIRRDSNLVQGFIEDCVEYDKDNRVSSPDLAAAHSSWWLEHKGEDRRTPSGESIAKAIRALNDPRICSERDNSRRYYCGIRLTKEGMRHWHNAVASEAFAFAGKKANTTDPSGDPNSDTPATWLSRATVTAMRHAHDSAVTGANRAVTDDLSSTQPIGLAGPERF